MVRLHITDIEFILKFGLYVCIQYVYIHTYNPNFKINSKSVICNFTIFTIYTVSLQFKGWLWNLKQFPLLRNDDTKLGAGFGQNLQTLLDLGFVRLRIDVLCSDPNYATHQSLERKSILVLHCSFGNLRNRCLLLICRFQRNVAQWC